MNGINHNFLARPAAEKYEVFCGYLQHATLGPTFWPRPWLASKFGLDRFELGRLDSALCCTSGGYCATEGLPLRANCALIASCLSQASRKKTVVGYLKRLVALCIAGRTDSQSYPEGHTLPIHICGAACVHKRNALPTDRMQSLVRRRSFLDPKPHGWKRARME